MSSEECPEERIIPGPAGRVQRALRRRGAPAVDLESSQPPTWLTTQEYLEQELNRPDDGIGSSEDPFIKTYWVAAMNFATGQDFMFMTELDRSVPVTPICEIVKGGTMKIPKIVAMIESVELGWDKVSFKVNLKDPTGSIRATIHKTAVWEKETRDMIKVGAVLVLQKVFNDTPDGWFRQR